LGAREAVALWVLSLHAQVLIGDHFRDLGVEGLGSQVDLSELAGLILLDLGQRSNV